MRFLASTRIPNAERRVNITKYKMDSENSFKTNQNWVTVIELNKSGKVELVRKTTSALLTNFRDIPLLSPHASHAPLSRLRQEPPPRHPG